MELTIAIRFSAFSANALKEKRKGPPVVQFRYADTIARHFEFSETKISVIPYSLPKKTFQSEFPPEICFATSPDSLRVVLQ